jgi:hypothetical protein
LTCARVFFSSCVCATRAYGRLTVEKVHLGAEQFDDALRWYQKAAQTKPDDARGKEGKWWLVAASGGPRRKPLPAAPQTPPNPSHFPPHGTLDLNPLFCVQATSARRRR